MKKLDLNGLGVQEMNAEEMKLIDGGTIGESLASAWAWLKAHVKDGKLSINI